jgi:hypothetical protein
MTGVIVSSFAGFPEIPTLHPNPEEWSDPYTYIEV